MSEEKRIGDKLFSKSFILSKIEEELNQYEQELFSLIDSKNACRDKMKKVRSHGFSTSSEKYKQVKRQSDRYYNRINTVYNKIKKLRSDYKTYQAMDI